MKKKEIHDRTNKVTEFDVQHTYNKIWLKTLVWRQWICSILWEILSRSHSLNEYKVARALGAINICLSVHRCMGGFEFKQEISFTAWAVCCKVCTTVVCPTKGSKSNSYVIVGCVLFVFIHFIPLYLVLFNWFGSQHAARSSNESHFFYAGIYYLCSFSSSDVRSICFNILFIYIYMHCNDTCIHSIIHLIHWACSSWEYLFLDF